MPTPPELCEVVGPVPRVKMALAGGAPLAQSLIRPWTWVGWVEDATSRIARCATWAEWWSSR